MNIRSEEDLENLEARIRILLSRCDLDEVLFGLRQNAARFEPFMIAGTAIFAIKYALPPIRLGGRVIPLEWDRLAPIVDLVTQYAIADPVSFDNPIEPNFHGSNLIPIILRHLGNQSQYAVEPFGQFARSQMVFKDIPHAIILPKGIDKLDLEAEFKKITGVSLIDFLSVGFALHAAAYSNYGFTGGWFQKARSQGVTLPSDDVIRKILDEFASDPWAMRELHENRKQPDRRFAAYDYNPIVDRPLIKMRPRNSSDTLDDEYFIAPLPHLILRRITDGVYFQFRSKSFTDFFGHVFSEYVGNILRNSFNVSQIISEADILKSYKSGKVPDWIVVEEGVATLIECKATRFTGKALRTADSTEIDTNLRQLYKGLKQLQEFKSACEKHTSGLDLLRGVSKFYLIVVTFDDMPIINSVPFRSVIQEKLLSERVGLEHWQIFSVRELEMFQPHWRYGVKLKGLLNRLENGNYSEVINAVIAETGQLYKDSFLCEKEKEFYDRLNIEID